ncbi:MAG: hypothetical protein Q8L48_37895 [Archangium sp.]|nr:hypothetical protein [Archangium sp.]
MAAKKKAAKRAVKKAPKKKVAAKKVVAKKAASKKAAPKKAAPKKAAPKKAALKKAAPKVVVAKKKAAPAKKPAAPKKAEAPPPAPTPEAPAAYFSFPEEVAAFCELVNSGGAGEADLEGYADFNEQYKPSDWARNPAVDQQLLTFAMDGAGGQFTLWRQAGRELLDNPVVQLGDDGELHVLAPDFPSFVALVAAGVDLFSRETEDLTPRPQLQEFVAMKWGDRTFGDAASILSAAKNAWPNFEEWMRAQVPAN